MNGKLNIGNGCHLCISTLGDIVNVPNAIKKVGINQLGFNDLMMEKLDSERYAVIQ